jgi:hypothetical protein
VRCKMGTDEPFFLHGVFVFVLSDRETEKKTTHENHFISVGPQEGPWHVPLQDLTENSDVVEKENTRMPNRYIEHIYSMDTDTLTNSKSLPLNSHIQARPKGA